jgi:hypothetical protein
MLSTARVLVGKRSGDGARSARHNPASVKRRVVNRMQRFIGWTNVAERPLQASLVLRQNTRQHTLDTRTFAALSISHFCMNGQFTVNSGHASFRAMA